MTRYATNATIRAKGYAEYANLEAFIEARPRSKYAYRVEFDKYRGMFYNRKVLVQDELKLTLDKHTNTQ